jgi:dienelactone hydrolase
MFQLGVTWDDEIREGRMSKLASRRIGDMLALTLFFLALASPSATTQPQASAAANTLAPGHIIDSVACADDASETYALYLPSGYNPAKSWPIIYAFDPGARGKLPVKLYKDTAEKYGYIIAASNNSRNFPSQTVSRAANAVWRDTHIRLTIDPRRVYMMGFSGGARVATGIALRCEPCAVAGVISHGAGYSFPPSGRVRFAYFAFVGDQDFNWPEVVGLRHRDEECCSAFRLRVFVGQHQWAPPAIFEEAIQWLQLKAMQSGAAPPEPAFIDQQFSRAQTEADNAVRVKDAIAQLEAYRLLASDFSGLKEVGQYQAKLAALKKSPELKQALRKEQEAIDQQSSLTQELSSDLSAAGDAGLETQMALRTAIADGMNSLKSNAEHAKNEDTRLILLRAFRQLWVQGIEAGQAALENSKNYARAEFYFQLVSSATPDEPWPALLLAETYALRGDRKRACKNLREAVKRGLKNPDVIEQDANLQSLHPDPEFRRIVADLKAQAQSQSVR